eukprot:260940_1
MFSSFNSADNSPLLYESLDNTDNSGKKLSSPYKRTIIFLLSVLSIALIWHYASGSTSKNLNKHLSLQSNGQSGQNKEKETAFVLARAEFNNYGVDGYVEANQDGEVTISININDIDASLCGNTDTLGYGYHIHTDWRYIELLNKFGPTDCGPDYTAGHFNPFDVVTCDNLSYNEEITYFNCEVGDLSGRFGIAIPDENGYIQIDGTIQDLRPEMLYTRSIVFHCSDGQRLFCAPFTIIYTV